MIYLFISLIYLPYLDRQTQISFKLIVMAARTNINKARSQKTGNHAPYSLPEVRGYFNVPSNQPREDAGEGAYYGVSSLFEKTKMPSHLSMS